MCGLSNGLLMSAKHKTVRCRKCNRLKFRLLSKLYHFLCGYTASKTGKAPESLEICALCHLVQPILPWVRELVPQFFQQNMTDSNKPSKRPKNASSIARWSHEWQVIFDWQVLASKTDFTHYFGDFKVSVYPK